jgi:hypothetical protein
VSRGAPLTLQAVLNREGLFRGRSSHYIVYLGVEVAPDLRERTRDYCRLHPSGLVSEVHTSAAPDLRQTAWNY